ncbi:MAG TPA: TetR/AcrR family transcriptional regulator [Thermoleophilaceae bacterium]
MPRAKQRTPELRDRVLAVAIALLARDGAVGFTTRAVAREAETSPPAVYELFGDKGGLVRAMFFEGFRRLRARLDSVPQSDDPRADLVQLIANYRDFVREHPVLSEVMFSRPFTDFDPGPTERDASGSVRLLIVERVRRCVDAGIVSGDETDIAHALVALTQGLAAAENARRLGTSRESVDRRWALAVNGLLDGLGMPGLYTIAR